MTRNKKLRKVCARTGGPTSKTHCGLVSQQNRAISTAPESAERGARDGVYGFGNQIPSGVHYTNALHACDPETPNLSATLIAFIADEKKNTPKSVCPDGWPDFKLSLWARFSTESCDQHGARKRGAWRV